MASPTDTTPSPDGTLVEVVDSTGKSVEQFATTKWSVHTSPGGSKCPVWINTVVISPTVPGAQLGAHLAGEDTAGQSSCSDSEKVLAILVDENGKLQDLKSFPHAIVRDIFPPDVKINGMLVAATLWLSEASADEIIANTNDEDLKTTLRTMADRCIHSV